MRAGVKCMESYLHVRPGDGLSLHLAPQTVQYRVQEIPFHRFALPILRDATLSVIGPAIWP